ncbi:MAG: 4-hydroxy-tetrahydrodipicolinate synthase [Magnetococcales bacterium]|nr:4-hydroxy-tetrahydrodipicolinate synthase [Magnetococcales bacterium]
MFKGVFTALITPFRDGEIDQVALAGLVEFQIANGIHGLVPCGTTGESATLSHDEHREVIRRVVELVGGRVPVLAGTGSNCTRESVELTRYAKSVGANGALLITPYYNKPTPDGLVAHYETIARSVDLPLVLYNVPGRTAVDMKAETVLRLVHLPQVVGIKEATADLERAARLHAACGDSFTLLSGDDGTFLPFLAIGGHGVISVTSNVAPHRMVKLWERWQAGDLFGARQEHEALLPLHALMFCETNPIPVKAAAVLRGLCTPEIRLPLTPLSEGRREALRQAMARLGLLPEGHA